MSHTDKTPAPRRLMSEWGRVFTQQTREKSLFQRLASAMTKVTQDDVIRGGLVWLI